jgi:hypothetical protein
VSLAVTLFFLNLSRHIYLDFLIAAPGVAVLSHRELASIRVVHDSYSAQESNKINTLYRPNPSVSELNAQWVLLMTGIFMRAEKARPLNCITLTLH